MLQDGSPIKWCCKLYLRRGSLPGLNLIALLNHQVGLNKSTDFFSLSVWFLHGCVPWSQLPGSMMLQRRSCNWRQQAASFLVSLAWGSLLHKANRPASYSPQTLTSPLRTLYRSKLPAESVHDSTSCSGVCESVHILIYIPGNSFVTKAMMWST